MSNYQKVPLTRALNVFAGQKADDAIEQQGKGYPGQVVAVAGSIVTVSFSVDGLNLQQVTMPVAGSIYVRLPIQVGDMGVALPASLSLGQISGLGTGPAQNVIQGNLSTLVWVPVTNANWAGIDPNVLLLQGPNGVQVKDLAGTASIELLTGGSITLSAGGHTILIDSTGVSIDGILFAAHQHTAVTSGTDDSGPVFTG